MKDNEYIEKIVKWDKKPDYDGIILSITLILIGLACLILMGFDKYTEFMLGLFTLVGGILCTYVALFIGIFLLDKSFGKNRRVIFQTIKFKSKK